MPGFCGNCGAALREGAGFCPRCGTAAAPHQAAASYQPASSSPVPPPGSFAPAAAPAAKGSSTLLKVVLVVFGVFAIGAILTVAGIVYTGYRVKQAITQKAADNGIDLGALTSGQHGQAYEPCSLLTTAEASEVLGVTVVRSEASGESCSYFIQPPTQEEKSNAVASAFESVRQNNAASAGDSMGGSPSAPAEGGTEAARKAGIEQLAKAFTSAAVDANTPYFTVEVNPDGNQLMAATKIALAATGVPGSSEKIDGIGDQAVMGPLDSMMVFVKNGTGVQIDLRLVANGRDRGIAMARHMLARM